MAKDVIHVYDPNEGTGEFCKSLCGKIGNKYKFTDVKKVDPETKCFPLMVLVHNYSRIGTDIDSALRDIPVLDDEKKAKVIIVVYHIQAEHALPQLMPTSTLAGDKYLNYGCLVDFFYTREENIYSCRLNKNAEGILRDYLKKVFEKNKGQSAQTKELQMYNPEATQTEKEFRHELCEKLKQYKVKYLEDAGNVSGELPLIVIVEKKNHNVEKKNHNIETDIDTAITGLDGIEPNQVAVVVFHETEASLSSSKQAVQHNHKYSRYGCIVYFVYTQQDKIKSCTLNKNAKKQMRTFLEKWKKKKPKEESKKPSTVCSIC